jgi:hypothetical protein
VANPPISIPPFNNVPAPGSPIRSDWPQQITHYAVDNITRLEADTGWVNLAIVTGMTGNLLFRRIGALVTVVVSLTRSGANLGNVTSTFGTITEVASRPSATIPGALVVNNPQGVARLNVLPTGAITALNLSVNDTGVIQGSAAYLVQLP